MKSLSLSFQSLSISLSLFSFSRLEEIIIHKHTHTPNDSFLQNISLLRLLNGTAIFKFLLPANACLEWFFDFFGRRFCLLPRSLQHSAWGVFTLNFLDSTHLVMTVLYNVHKMDNR